jgi:uncharacterized protein YqgV (UPF0045/DUF77 family)
MEIVNLGIQIIPKTAGDQYAVIDQAIQVVQQSGLKYLVCPFETVIEGEYARVLQVVEAMQQACYAAGATEVLVNIRLQRRFNQDVAIEEKTGKYR